MPSKVDSVLYEFLNVIVADGDVTLNAGVSRAEAFTDAGSLANAAFGAELGLVVVVTQLIPVPDVCSWTQPAGNAGGVTPSKFWLNVT
jgi:hypothetical protein